MRNRFGLAAVLLLFLAAPAAAQDITGQYNVTGSNPGGGGSYQGIVTVQQTGETYRVDWRIGSQTFQGYGILDRGTLSVAYNGGLAVYQVDGNGARGIWTTTSGTQLGREDWTR